MTKDITKEKAVIEDLRYLQLLSRSFPTIADASTEIINLEAILNLPKGTEHFLSDLHGEYQAFNHVLKNASGSIKRKVSEIFSNTMRDSEKKELCTLIYYPEEKLLLVKAVEKELDDWYIKSPQSLAARVLVYHSGAVARIVGRAQQVCVCGPNHPYHHLDRPRRRFYHCDVQLNPAADHRPTAHHRRHL